MIKRMDHINVVVSDLEKSRAFFCLLGFSEGIRSELDAHFLEKLTGIRGARGRFVSLHYPGSEVAVELLQFDGSAPSEDDPAGADRIGYRHLAFAVADIEETVRRLREHGVEFLSPIQTWAKTGKKLVYFRGPDGILLELAEYPRGENPQP